jgi:hypothetical protein
VPSDKLNNLKDKVVPIIKMLEESENSDELAKKLMKIL